MIADQLPHITMTMEIKRREFCKLGAGGALAGIYPAIVENLAAKEPAGKNRPIVGTIRWDAFYGTGTVAKAVEKSLGPAKYQHRAPFFAKVTGRDSLGINGDSDEVLAREIEYAAQAGVYWAFLNYGWNADMSRPLRRFLKHPDRGRVNFTIILNEGLLCKNEWEEYFRKTLLEAARMTNFQTVLGGCPLIYTFYKREHGANQESRDLIRRRLEKIRDMLGKETGKDPYLVHFMHQVPQEEWPIYRDLGYDATTLYAHFGRNGQSYDAFRKQAEGSWQAWIDNKIPHVPLLSAGWDNRPRYDNPVPWVEKSESMLKHYCVSPTAEELAAHVRAGMDFVHANREGCPAQSLMMYAWNEHDEGGWLCPTLDPATGGADDSRVRAVGKAIRDWKPAKG